MNNRGGVWRWEKVVGPSGYLIGMLFISLVVSLCSNCFATHCYNLINFISYCICFFETSLRDFIHCRFTIYIYRTKQQLVSNSFGPTENCINPYFLYIMQRQSTDNPDCQTIKGLFVFCLLFIVTLTGFLSVYNIFFVLNIIMFQT